jgi:hypothetical protein
MKAILEFNLPEERDEFEQASNAWKYHSVLWDFDQFLRNKIKYTGDEVTQDVYETLKMIRDNLWIFIEEHNLDLDK